MAVQAIVFDAYGTLYDVQSVAALTEREFAGDGELITQLWRLKQLEYSWLRSLMGSHADFWTVTRDALLYTLDCLGLAPDDAVVDRLLQKYLSLDLYPDAKDALAALSGYRLAILSNGSQAMLDALVRDSGLDTVLDATISIDSRQVFKPSPAVYTLIEERLGVQPRDVLFVTSNGFDACGARNFGLEVAWIERVSAGALRQEIRSAAPVGPRSMFKALRQRPERLGCRPDHVIASLAELPALLARAPRTGHAAQASAE